MFFKDHLKIVTDAGAVLHLGWDYNAPYNLDPLNGVDVDIQTAQGINQTGTTVERQSVAGHDPLIPGAGILRRTVADALSDIR